MHEGCPSFDAEGSIDDTAGPSDVQSSLEVPTDSKKLNLLHSSDDDGEELWKVLFDFLNKNLWDAF